MKITLTPLSLVIFLWICLVSYPALAAQIEQGNIVYVPQSIMQVHVDAFAHNQTLCKKGQPCLKHLTKTLVVGVFRSHGLIKYLQPRTNASVVEVTLMEQGIKMLEHNRIDVLVLPNVNLDINQLTFVERVASVDLYLWLDEKYTSHVDQISLQIQRLKSEPIWSSAISSN